MSLYDFSALKEFVIDKFQINPDEIDSGFQPIRIKLDRSGLEKKVHETDNGFEYTDEFGNKHKGFLFIEKGYNRATAVKHGYKTIVPKFHIYNCLTITQQKLKDNFNGHYVFSQKAEQLKDLDGEVKYLEICMNCVKKSRELNKRINSLEYYENYLNTEKLKEGFSLREMPKKFNVNAWGYTHDWNEITAKYRAMHDFTCESCGIKLNNNLADAYYLDTHHISGNKTNNANENLNCLCVLCHSQVNEEHIHNFSTGVNRQRIKDFIELFRHELEIIKNPYLNSTFIDRIQ